MHLRGGEGAVGTNYRCSCLAAHGVRKIKCDNTCECRRLTKGGCFTRLKRHFERLINTKLSIAQKTLPWHYVKAFSFNLSLHKK